MSYYKGKTVWITGASAGIGRALALALAERGADLILSSRKQAALDIVAQECQNLATERSITTIVIPLDLEDHQGLETLLNAQIKHISKVDILINNGGISQRSKVANTSFKVYKRLMDINYLGTVQISLGILPYFLKKNKGHFVTITSMAGKFGVPYRSGYSASKMALHGFFEAMRAELTGQDIAITMVCPGYIKTDISKNALTSSGEAQGTMDDAQRNGMEVEVLVSKMLKAISLQKEEVHIGGFKETKMAGLISRLLPSTFRKVIAKAKVT